ncbi:MAG: hypothetical protein ACRDHN_13160 [Thermomicrobiales bacterium]
MSGGTPLFADHSLATIRGLLGALIILAFAAILITTVVGDRRYASTPADSISVSVTHEHTPYR